MSLYSVGALVLLLIAAWVALRVRASRLAKADATIASETRHLGDVVVEIEALAGGARLSIRAPELPDGLVIRRASDALPPPEHRDGIALRPAQEAVGPRAAALVGPGTALGDALRAAEGFWTYAPGDLETWVPRAADVERRIDEGLTLLALLRGA